MVFNLFKRRTPPTHPSSAFAATVASTRLDLDDPADGVEVLDEPTDHGPYADPDLDTAPAPLPTPTRRGPLIPVTPARRPALPAGCRLPLLTDVAAVAPPVRESGTTARAGGPGAAARPAADPVAPRYIGRYEVHQPLGAGGLGQVHEAWDPLLSRTVAVKTLQLPSGDEARFPLDALFLHEARAVAGLNHPHIVTVHDAGLSERGVYIAMERLHGQDLRHALAGGWKPTPGQSALLVRRVADALAYAHARGVVHCDIKPANIFITRKDKPKVLDFGIAHVTRGARRATNPGVAMGSPHYLAPEQLQDGPVDARTDIHALGAVFYELLTGRKAFAGDSLDAITTAVLRHDPPLAHDVRRGVPATLAAIAARAMAREPSDRYATAAEMAGDLRAWIGRHPDTDGGVDDNFRPLRVQPPARAEPPRPRSDRLPLGLATAGALLLAAAVLAWQQGPRQGALQGALQGPQAGAAAAQGAPAAAAPAR